MDHKRLSRVTYACVQIHSIGYRPLEFGKLYPHAGAEIGLSMKRASFLALHFLIIPGLFGCSINVVQPTTASPTLSPTTKPDNIATSSLQTTQIPVTWTSLNLTGRLIYISTDTL